MDVCSSVYRADAGCGALQTGAGTYSNKVGKEECVQRVVCVRFLFSA